MLTKHGHVYSHSDCCFDVNANPLLFLGTSSVSKFHGFLFFSAFLSS